MHKMKNFGSRSPPHRLPCTTRYRRRHSPDFRREIDAHGDTRRLYSPPRTDRRRLNTETVPHRSEQGRRSVNDFDGERGGYNGKKNDDFYGESGGGSGENRLDERRVNGKFRKRAYEGNEKNDVYGESGSGSGENRLDEWRVNGQFRKRACERNEKKDFYDESGGGYGENRDLLDERRVGGHFRKQVYEGSEGPIPNKEQTSIKFQQEHLFDERSNSAGYPSLGNYCNASDGVGDDSTRVSIEKEYHGNRSSNTIRHDIDRTGGMISSSMISSSYQPDSGTGQVCNPNLNNQISDSYGGHGNIEREYQVSQYPDSHNRDIDISAVSPYRSDFSIGENCNGVNSSFSKQFSPSYRGGDKTRMSNERDNQHASGYLGLGKQYSASYDGGDCSSSRMINERKYHHESCNPELGKQFGTGYGDGRMSNEGKYQHESRNPEFGKQFSVGFGGGRMSNERENQHESHNQEPGKQYIAGYGGSRMSNKREYQHENSNSGLGKHFSSQLDDGSGIDNTRTSNEREYQQRCQMFDMSKHEIVVSKQMSSEIGKPGTLLISSSYHPDSGIRERCSTSLDVKLQSPMKNPNVGDRFLYDEQLEIRDSLHNSESSNREFSYKNYENPMLMKDMSHHTTAPYLHNYDYASVSSGITNAKFPGIYRDGIQASRDATSITRGMLGEHVSHDGYDRPTISSYNNSELQMKDVKNHLYTYCKSTSETNLPDYAYPDVHRTESGDLGTFNDEKYQIKTIGQEGCDYQERGRASISDSRLARVNDTTQGFHGDNVRLRSSILDSSLDMANDTQRFHGDIVRTTTSNLDSNLDMVYDTQRFLGDMSRLSRVFDGDQYLREQPGVFEHHRSVQEQLGGFEDHHSSPYAQQHLGLYEGHHSLLEQPRVFKRQNSLQERKIPVDYSDLSMEQSGEDYHMSNQSREMWSSQNIDLQFKTEQYQSYESLNETKKYRDHGRLHESQIYGDHDSSHVDEDYGNCGAYVPRSYDENLSRVSMPNCDADQYLRGFGTHRRLTAEELGSPGPSETIYERKHGGDTKTSKHKPGGHTTVYKDEYELVNAKYQRTGKNIDNSHLPHKARHFVNKKALRQLSMTSHKTNSSGDSSLYHNLPINLRMRLSKPEMPTDRDIQKRLGPAHHNNLNNSSVKNQSSKYEQRKQDGFVKSFDSQGGQSSEAKVIPAKINLSEDSEDFKQLVNIAFLKFVKQIYESPSQLRRFMEVEQGKGGKLNCSVCDSGAGFADTTSFAMHLFNARKGGFRPQHLGFHKALCVLMGWNSAVSPNTPRASLELSKAEALALKEDLAIWPPIVIIHNSSAGNNNPDKRLVVTAEVLQTILKDMGFGEDRIQVSQGKASNQSIMIVKFKATFSGLQEAQKLDKLYSQKTRGRSEFQQISSDNGNSSTIKAENSEENVLYGYLGIAEDLDKLDSETKKRSSVKSKREIQAIAEASFKIE